MDAQSLRREAEKIRVDAISKQKQAGQFMQNAVGHNRDGNIQQVQVDEARADQLNEEARELEEQALELERQVAIQINQAHDIEKEQERLRADFDSKMKDLENKKRNLLGTPTSII